eukprot:1921487-Rhodomonas_salina.3
MCIRDRTHTHTTHTHLNLFKVKRRAVGYACRTRYASSVPAHPIAPYADSVHRASHHTLARYRTARSTAVGR